MTIRNSFKCILSIIIIFFNAASLQFYFYGPFITWLNGTEGALSTIGLSTTFFLNIFTLILFLLPCLIGLADKYTVLYKISLWSIITGWTGIFIVALYAGDIASKIGYRLPLFHLGYYMVSGLIVPIYIFLLIIPMNIIYWSVIWENASVSKLEAFIRMMLMNLLPLVGITLISIIF